jgi:hypothetical protein
MVPALCHGRSRRPNRMASVPQSQEVWGVLRHTRFNSTTLTNSFFINEKCTRVIISERGGYQKTQVRSKNVIHPILQIQNVTAIVSTSIPQELFPSPIFLPQSPSPSNITLLLSEIGTHKPLPTTAGLPLEALSNFLHPLNPLFSINRPH